MVGGLVSDIPPTLEYPRTRETRPPRPRRARRCPAPAPGIAPSASPSKKRIRHPEPSPARTPPPCAHSGAVRFFLGGTLAPTRHLALRWLRGQAHRLADGLDPDPRTAKVSAGALRPVPAYAGDAPAELRRWATGLAEQGRAVEQLGASPTYLFVAREEAAWYLLTARPLLTSPPAPTPAAAPSPPSAHVCASPPPPASPPRPRWRRGWRGAGPATGRGGPAGGGIRGGSR